MSRSALGPVPLRRLPTDAVGVADARLLPDDEFARSWDAIVLENGRKALLARTAAAGMVLRGKVPFESLPLHGIQLLVGPPGTGKTTLARGLADRVARVVGGIGQWAFIEVDPHGLNSSALGRSQRAVEQLFNEVLDEQARLGPLAVLLDEVETLTTDRAKLSFDANPADVHRAVDAALVGLDQLARRYPQVLFIATSNFEAAIDGALRSRADLVFRFGLPSVSARRAILAATLRGVGAAFPGAAKIATQGLLHSLAAASEGLDGRQLRKSIATACGMRDATARDPNQLTGDDLLGALALIREEVS